MTTLNLNNSNQFLYLKDINNDDPFIYVVYKERVKSINLNETYDRFGQIISNEDAGDWSIYNQYADAEHSCIEAVKKEFGLTSLKYGFDDPEKIDFLILNNNGKIEIEGSFDDDEIENYNEEKINQFIKKWEKENAEYTTVEGFNYWDGSNNRSIIVSSDDDSGLTHEKLYAHEIPEIDFNNLQLLENGFGREVYEYGEWYVIKSQFASSWENYKVINKANIERDQL